MSETHHLLDGKAAVYRRENSRFWQCAIYLGRRNHRASTRQESLALALDYAREWALDRLAEDRLNRRRLSPPAPAAAPATEPALPRQPSPAEKTFRDAAEAFVAEYEAITRGERNASYVASKSRHVRLYLQPFFGDRPISEVTPGLIQDYRLHRMDPASSVKRPGRPAKRPARNTLHQELVTLRQVLKTANRKGWLSALPDMSAPYKANGKVSHRAWFSPEELKRLLAATAERARNPKNERWRSESEAFHDYVLFMVGTGMRPDEASRLEYRDVSVVRDADTGERILEIEVRGKRGVGFCKSLPTAVAPFQRMRKRSEPKATDLLFGAIQRELMNAVLAELDLKHDREGNARTAYSLRHTYICQRLMEGADIYQVAKNCRTSVDMIEKFYAAHIKNRLDASAINVRRTRRNAHSANKALANAKAP